MRNDRSAVKMNVTLKSGAEFEVSGPLDAANKFHDRYRKYMEGQRARTDSYQLLDFGGQIFTASEIASYAAETIDGNKIDFRVR